MGRPRNRDSNVARLRAFAEDRAQKERLAQARAEQLRSDILRMEAEAVVRRAANEGKVAGKRFRCTERVYDAGQTVIQAHRLYTAVRKSDPTDRYPFLLLSLARKAASSTMYGLIGYEMLAGRLTEIEAATSTIRLEVPPSLRYLGVELVR
jgi:hypothetical protein